jgi:hypothetical protein
VIVFWGKKYVDTRLGYVADFCPLCREVRAFELKRVGLAGHIFYISLTDGDLVGHERKCTVCGTELSARPEIYARPSREPRALRELIAQTFPNLATHYAGRFALEKAIRDPFAKIPQDDRLALLKEPFSLLSYKAEAQFRASLISTQATLVFFAALISGGIASAPLAVALAPLAVDLPEYEHLIWVAVLIAASIIAWISSFWFRKRLLRKEILPPLLSALRPLRPTLDELVIVLKDLKALGLQVGSKIEPQWVMAELQSYVPPKAT